MKKDEIKTRIDALNVWKRRGQRAPHKPLLFLYALGCCLRGEGRLIPYSEIDQDLKKLLVEFGPSRKSYHPEYPFWRLQRDGLWEVMETDRLESKNASGDVPKTELLKHNVHGGFASDVYRQLQSDRALLAGIVSRILNAHFPASIHEDILQAVGIDLEDVAAKAKIRDPHFRDRVLRAYEYRCAVCGFDVRVGDSLVGLEAAHIKWHQAGGPDEDNNGICLCTMHHKLFDRGPSPWVMTGR